jgi:hypothetical protein
MAIGFVEILWLTAPHMYCPVRVSGGAGKASVMADSRSQLSDKHMSIISQCNDHFSRPERKLKCQLQWAFVSNRIIDPFDGMPVQFWWTSCHRRNREVEFTARAKRCGRVPRKIDTWLPRLIVGR